MSKMFAIGSIPPSILVTALALGSVIDLYCPGAVHWAAPFSTGLHYYRLLSQDVLGPLTTLAGHEVNLSMPRWTPDALVVYAASTAAFGTVRSNFATALTGSQIFKSPITSAGWPLAVVSFALHAFFNRGVSRFASEHTALFVTHCVAVGSVIAMAACGSHIPLPTGSWA